MVSSLFSASCSPFMTATWLEISPQSFGVYTVSQSRSVVTSAVNPAPDNSPQSIRELRNGHVANLQELYYTRLVRQMAWYKILIHVLIVWFLRITMCSRYWWCTKHAQLIMGTWPIYKKKYSPHDFYIFISFQFVNVWRYVRVRARVRVRVGDEAGINRGESCLDRKGHISGDNPILHIGPGPEVTFGNVIR